MNFNTPNKLISLLPDTTHSLLHLPLDISTLPCLTMRTRSLWSSGKKWWRQLAIGSAPGWNQAHSYILSSQTKQWSFNEWCDHIRGKNRFSADFVWMCKLRIHARAYGLCWCDTRSALSPLSDQFTEGYWWLMLVFCKLFIQIPQMARMELL